MSDLVVVASQNPVKLLAAQEGFQKMFPDKSFMFEGCSVDSGVSAQPMTHEETALGALNRAQNASQKFPQATYSIGIEGGIQPVNAQLDVFAYVVVLSNGRVGKAQTGVFTLPKEVAKLVRQGMELGEADDAVFGRSNSKQQNGSIGILTEDALTRTDYYVQAVIMALIPFKQPHLTWE